MKTALNVGSFWLLAVMFLLGLNSVASMTFGAARAFSILMLLGCLVCLFTSKKAWPKVLGRPGIWCVLFLLAYLFVSISSGLLTGDLNLDLIQTYAASILVIMAAATTGWHFGRNKQIEEAYGKLFALMMIAVVSVLLSDYLNVLYLPDAPVVQSRNSGFFANPNEAGQLIAVSFAFGLGLMQQRRLRFILLLCIAAILLAVVLTYSKAAFLTVILITASHLFYSKLSLRQKSFSLLALGLVVGGTYWLLTSGLEQIRFSSIQERRLRALSDFILASDTAPLTGEGRPVLLELGVQRFLASPLLGNGLGSMHSIEGAPVSNEGVPQGTHNMFLLVLGESGVFVGALFLAFLISYLYWVLRCRDRVLRSCSLGYVLVFLVSIATSHNVFQTRFLNLMLGVSFGALAGGAKATKEQRRVSPRAA